MLICIGFCCHLVCFVVMSGTCAQVGLELMNVAEMVLQSCATVPAFPSAGSELRALCAVGKHSFSAKLHSQPSNVCVSVFVLCV